MYCGALFQLCSKRDSSELADGIVLVFVNAVVAISRLLLALRVYCPLLMMVDSYANTSDAHAEV
jgi:hypothetical protein